MSNIPEFFSAPLTSNGNVVVLPTSSPHIMKPVFGTVNQQFVRFFVDYHYSETKSKELNYEHMEPVEMCEIVNDPRTKYHCRVVDLTVQQRQEYSELYSRFKNQEDSLDTEIYSWVAAKPSEKALLEHCGFSTVEQLAQSPIEYISRLGPQGKELQEKAIKHMNAKGEKVKSSEYAEEIASLRRELEAERKRNDDKMEAFFQRESAKAKTEKKTRNRSKKETNEEAHPHAA